MEKDHLGRPLEWRTASTSWQDGYCDGIRGKSYNPPQTLELVNDYADGYEDGQKEAQNG